MRRPSRKLALVFGASIIVALLFGVLNFTSSIRISVLDSIPLERSLRSLTGATPAPPEWSEERRHLLEQLAQVQSLKVENERLREILSFTQKTNYSSTIANIISRDPLATSVVYLDVGSNDGIAVGQPVVIGAGTIVGKVVRVSSRNSTVELLTGDGSRLAVKALDDAATIGVVRGTLGTNARLEYIRDVSTLTVGTIVVTSGLEPLVPQGLVVGTIQKIVDNPDELFAYADVEPAADLNQLSVVVILRGL